VQGNAGLQERLILRADQVSVPHLDKSYLEYAGEKAASVRRLHRTSVAITHAGGSSKPREPFPVIAGIVAARSSWADGLGYAFRSNLPAGEDERLDCGCAPEDGAFDDFSGELEVVGADGTLIYFLFRLLGRGCQIICVSGAVGSILERKGFHYDQDDDQVRDFQA